MKYKAVIFDLFGTLVDSYDFLSYASVLRETSSILKIRHEDFLKLWQETEEKRLTGGFKTLEEALEHICRRLDAPVKIFDINLAKMVRYDYLAGTYMPRQYAIETLSEIKKEGLKLALISNCTMETPDFWPNTPFAPFFDAVVFSSACGLLKPDPRIFQLAVEQLGVELQECIFVDDSGNNLAAAKELGITAVQIENLEENEKTHAMAPKGEWNGIKIKDLAELLDILEGQNEI